jgi:hypothetical protein
LEAKGQRVREKVSRLSIISKYLDMCGKKGDGVDLLRRFSSLVEQQIRER